MWKLEASVGVGSLLPTCRFCGSHTSLRRLWDLSGGVPTRAFKKCYLPAHPCFLMCCCTCLLLSYKKRKLSNCDSDCICSTKLKVFPSSQEKFPNCYIRPEISIYMVETGVILVWKAVHLHSWALGLKQKLVVLYGTKKKWFTSFLRPTSLWHSSENSSLSEFIWILLKSWWEGGGVVV